jgi:hypothetical protein
MGNLFYAALWRQFRVAINSLESALLTCPSSLWTQRLWPAHSEPYLPQELGEFWYTVYHALFWFDLYLSGCREEEFTPPAPFVWTESDPAVSPEHPYTQEELHTYLITTRQKCQEIMYGLTDERASQRVDYPWIKEGEVYSYLELQLYNMRHVQEHAAQLNLFLGQHATSSVSP